MLNIAERMAISVPPMNQAFCGQKCALNSRSRVRWAFAGGAGGGSDVMVVTGSGVEQLVGVQDEIAHFGLVYRALGR